MGTVISADDMKKAVFKKGFNPFALGLVPGAALLPSGLAAGEYDRWKRQTAQDTSDWNICAKCMAVLRSYLTGTPKAAGIATATVSSNPLLGAMAVAEAERAYGSSPPVGPPAAPPARPTPVKTKKWWQFWK